MYYVCVNEGSRNQKHVLCVCLLTWFLSDIRKSIRAPGSPSSRYVFTSLRSALLPEANQSTLKKKVAFLFLN